MDNKDSTLPMGVSLTASGKYEARIDFYLNLTEHIAAKLGTYPEIETASQVFQSVYLQKSKITSELEKMDPKNQLERIAHAQSYKSR